MPGLKISPFLIAGNKSVSATHIGQLPLEAWVQYNSATELNWAGWWGWRSRSKPGFSESWSWRNISSVQCTVVHLKGMTFKLYKAANSVRHKKAPPSLKKNPKQPQTHTHPKSHKNQNLLGGWHHSWTRRGSVPPLWIPDWQQHTTLCTLRCSTGLDWLLYQ